MKNVGVNSFFHNFKVWILVRLWISEWMNELIWNTRFEFWKRTEILLLILFIKNFSAWIGSPVLSLSTRLAFTKWFTRNVQDKNICEWLRIVWISKAGLAVPPVDGRSYVMGSIHGCSRSRMNWVAANSKSVSSLRNLPQLLLNFFFNIIWK